MRPKAPLFNLYLDLPGQKKNVQASNPNLQFLLELKGKSIFLMFYRYPISAISAMWISIQIGNGKMSRTFTPITK